MSDIEHIQGWSPHRPSCYSCVYYDEGIEHGDYGSVLSVDPNCFSDLQLDQDNDPEFPHDDAPECCVLSGRYTLDANHAFWASPFVEDLNRSDVSIESAFEGFIWWMENIKAAGL